MTAAELARMIGRSPRSVQTSCARGTIKATRVGRDWMIDGEEAARVWANPPPVGYPRGLPWSPNRKPPGPRRKKSRGAGPTE